MMEDHFILFPIMVIIWLCKGIWYTLQLIYFILGAICLLIYKLFKKTDKNEIEMDDYLNK